LESELEGVDVGADDLSYPVLGVFPNGALKIAATPAYLTTYTSRGLKRGHFNDLRLVDSQSKWYRVRSAHKLHGVGRFGGYSIFFNQWIRVGLDLEDEHREASLEDVKGIVLKDFDSWDGWRSRGDFDVLMRRVKGARTIPELLGTLAAMVR
jgi:hypothetical protein